MLLAIKYTIVWNSASKIKISWEKEVFSMLSILGLMQSDRTKWYVWTKSGLAQLLDTFIF